MVQPLVKIPCPDCGSDLYVRLDFGVITQRCWVVGDGEIEWDPTELLGREPSIEGFYCGECSEDWDWTTIFQEDENGPCQEGAWDTYLEVSNG